MRKSVLAAWALLATSHAATALAQEAAPDRHWTYIALSDGTIGWQDSNVTRDPAAKTARVATFFYYNTPNDLPNFATLEIDTSNAARTYDFESRIVTYACAGDTFVNETGLFFTIVGDRPKTTATSEQQPYDHVSSEIDATIRKAVCEGVNPENTATAKTLGELINISVAREKAAH